MTFDIDTKDNSVPSNRKEVIQPYLYNGKDTLWLDAVEVYGKNRLKRERQEQRLNGNSTWELEEGKFLRGAVYNYSDQTQLKKWMTPANLGIRREIVGCACEDMSGDQFIASATLYNEPPVEPRRIISGCQLADASRMWDMGEQEHEIIFRLSKILIDSTIFNNEVAFGQILAAVDKIYSYPDFKVKQIEIAGYASPEGKQNFNRWLAGNRAKALVDYIIVNRPQYNLGPDNFKIVNGEENWDGLRKLTLASGLDEKEKTQIIDIIDSRTGAARKEGLKGLNGGRTYLKMKKEVYPHLRSARYLAISYDSSKDEAVDMINEANSQIRNGEYKQALETVKPYAADFRAYNTLGVALMMNGEFEKALPYFEKAIAEGSEEATINKALIETELEYEETRRREREEYLKRFE